MTSVGIYEAKTHLAQLVERVAAGETVQITKHGRPVAALVPIDVARDEEHRQAVRALLAMPRPTTRTTPEEIKAWIEEGRR